MKKFLAMLLALTMALALVACGGNNSAGTSGNDAGGANTSGDTAGDASGAAGGTFTIGVIGPLTGGNAIYGTNVANAAQIAVDEINALGGDVQFSLISEDDTGDAETAVNAYNALMDQGMQILLGTVTPAPPWPWCPTPMRSGCSP